MGVKQVQSESRNSLEEESKRLRKERDFWKATVITLLVENESGDGVDNEMYEYERERQQALNQEGTAERE